MDRTLDHVNPGSPAYQQLVDRDQNLATMDPVSKTVTHQGTVPRLRTLPSPRVVPAPPRNHENVRSLSSLPDPVKATAGGGSEPPSRRPSIFAAGRSQGAAISLLPPRPVESNPRGKSLTSDSPDRRAQATSAHQIPRRPSQSATDGIPAQPLGVLPTRIALFKVGEPVATHTARFVRLETPTEMDKKTIPLFCKYGTTTAVLVVDIPYTHETEWSAKLTLLNEGRQALAAPIVVTRNTHTVAVCPTVDLTIHGKIVPIARRLSDDEIVDDLAHASSGPSRLVLDVTITENV